jgi:hypothetical protein
VNQIEIVDENDYNNVIKYYTSTQPPYPIMDGDVLSYVDNEWVYTTYSDITKAAILKDLKEKTIADFNNIFLAATRDSSPIDVLFPKNSQTAYKLLSDISNIENIMKDGKNCVEKHIKFGSIDDTYYFEVEKNDKTKREVIIETVLDKIALFKRSRSVLRGCGLSKIQTLESVEELENFIINIGDFDQDGQDKGWRFVDNKMQLILDNVQNTEFVNCKKINSIYYFGLMITLSLIFLKILCC